MNRATTLSCGDLAEQAGAGIAEDAIAAILAAKNQAERGDILRDALVALAALPVARRAAGGFAGLFVSVVERGLGQST